jgi:hypothetical protein
MTLQEIVTLVEEYTGTQSSTTSSYPLASKVRDINLALDSYNLVAERASSFGWQSSDDTNHLDYPIMYVDPVDGIQDYSFKEDEQGNQINNIFKVRAKDANGNWHTLTQVDFESTEDADYATTGFPTKYNLTANGIFLVPTPDYSMENGIEVWYSRTNSYFTVDDLTKEAGIPNIFHEYLALSPSYKWLLRNDQNKASLYRADLENMKKSVETFHAERNRARKVSIKPRSIRGFR